MRTTPRSGERCKKLLLYSHASVMKTPTRRRAYILVMNIHFVGINGVSMRALADLAASRGHNVTGSDRDTGGHDGRNVTDCDLVVYTNAVPEDNCETEGKKWKLPR